MRYDGMDKEGDESKNRRALVIDDEEKVRKHIKILLSKRNYIIEEAADGDQAIEKILTRKYDLIICDIRMPKKDGWEVLRVIRSNPESKDVPVIILGRLVDNEDMKRVYDEGANYYITKPFTPSQRYYGIRLVFEEVKEFWKG